MTMTRDDAAARAAAHLTTIANTYGSPYVLMLDAVREGARYWLFPYNTQRFAETRAPQDGAVGNGPILIDKSNGTVYQVPTGGRERWIAEFERTGVAPVKRA